MSTTLYELRLVEGEVRRLEAEVSRLREEVERLRVERDEALANRLPDDAPGGRRDHTGRPWSATQTANFWSHRARAALARAEEAERERDEARAKLVTVIECEGVTAHRALMDSLAASESREKALRDEVERLREGAGKWPELLDAALARAEAAERRLAHDTEEWDQAHKREWEKNARLLDSLAASEAQGRALREALEEAVSLIKKDAEGDRARGWERGAKWNEAKAAEWEALLSGSSPAPSGVAICGGSTTCNKCGSTFWNGPCQVPLGSPSTSGDVHRDDGQGFRKEEP